MFGYEGSPQLISMQVINGITSYKEHDKNGKVIKEANEEMYKE